MWKGIYRETTSSRFMKNRVPRSLEHWFVIHFIVDVLFGLPLLLAPEWTLHLFGFPAVELLTTRLVGAALLGIGGVSLIVRQKSSSREVYNTLLSLKLIWSWAAILGIFMTILETGQKVLWLFLLIFVFFFLLWGWYQKVCLVALTSSFCCRLGARKRQYALA